ncbi:MAG: PilZ domain-containing protein [Granulosicoccus sp.]
MTEQTRKGIISFSITDRGALHSSYLSFTQEGGLFVPTARNYELGDEIFMLLKVMDDQSVTSVTGTVVWITPAGSQGNKTPGIGVQFSESDNGATRANIEHHLAATLNSERPTQTM